MRGSRYLSSTRPVALAVLAAIAWGWLAPTSARASCGDYVVIPGEHPAHSAPSTHQVVPRPPVDSPTLPPHRLPPCHGPRCSAPAPTPLTVAPVPVLELEEWAIVARLGLPLSCGVRSCLVLRAPEGLRHRPGTVFRPPRFAPLLRSA